MNGTFPTNGRIQPTGDQHETRLGALILVLDHVHQVTKMTSHKPENEDLVRQEKILIGTGPDDVRILRTKRKPTEDLAILDEDFGGDPYNSTGQYAVLKDGNR